MVETAARRSLRDLTEHYKKLDENCKDRLTGTEENLDKVKTRLEAMDLTQENLKKTFEKMPGMA